MKNAINVLIVDDNVIFGDLLKEYMGRYRDINILGVARDGLEGIDMINSLTPDIVILDIIMPNLDGIGVLEKIAALGLKSKPLFVILSAIGQDIFIQKAISLGAEYYLVKPFDIDILVSRVRQIFQEKHESPFSFNKIVPRVGEYVDNEGKPPRSIEIEVTSLIREAGIPPHVFGYQYIREAVIQTLMDETKIFNSITKIIYPSVAKKFNTTPKKVERAIRSAIESAWCKSDSKPASLLSINGARRARPKPTNAEFIAMLAEKVRVNLGIKP